MTSSIWNLVLLISLSFFRPFVVQGKENVYVVYRGGAELLGQSSASLSHFQLLASVLESEDAVVKNMVHTYSHVFSGFAAKMTESHAKKASFFPGVLKVFKSKMYKLHTTRSWDYLGLPLDSSSFSDSILNNTNMGEGVIIGIIDGGIWPELESLNDEGLGPIPTRWKGICQEGQRFNISNCNRKLIGARWFVDGLIAERELTNETIAKGEYLSPRDKTGHGTHTATTAGGSIVKNVSYSGLGNGNVRGGAPKTRLAIYKACWFGGDCSTVDLLKAIDMAIHDGVDVLSLSVGGDSGISDDFENAMTLGSFHAVNKGVTFVCAGGNSGPQAQTITNIAPWMLTVAASNIDRSFSVPLTLGNNQTLTGEEQGVFGDGKSLSSIGLYFQENIDGYCENLKNLDRKLVQGKVVFCYGYMENAPIDNGLDAVLNASGAGLIIVDNPKSGNVDDCSVPLVTVSHETGWKILRYIRSTSSPRISIGPATTLVGKPIMTNIAQFSSRGPHPIIPEILKPDIAAPGVNVLAGSTELSYTFLSGTSISAPHVSGIVALLKSLHPDWSPAAIKSAIVTTGWTSDPWGEPIYSEGSPMKIADAFDYGGGIINPNAAADPGLIYDMGFRDYVPYLCYFDGYKIDGFPCQTKQFSFLDMNLPSIIVPSLMKSVILTRTVTNVGPVDSVYHAKVKVPRGIYVEVVEIKRSETKIARRTYLKLWYVGMKNKPKLLTNLLDYVGTCLQQLEFAKNNLDLSWKKIREGGGRVSTALHHRL